MWRPTRRAALTAAAASVVARPARAIDEVDVALLLAVDVSSSVDAGEFRIQMDGYAAAFRDSRFARAVGAGNHGAIAVAFLQWAGVFEQQLTLDWRIVRTVAQSRAVAAQIATMERYTVGPATSISAALDFARRVFVDLPLAPTRRVIDISGDGMNNAGRLPTSARDEALAAGIVINGLPLLTEEETLDEYYRKYVVGGENSFTIPVRNYREFARGILAKLVREVA